MKKLWLEEILKNLIKLKKNNNQITSLSELKMWQILSKGRNEVAAVLEKHGRMSTRNSTRFGCEMVRCFDVFGSDKSISPLR